jgi:hypothetical protein
MIVWCGWWVFAHVPAVDLGPLTAQSSKNEFQQKWGEFGMEYYNKNYGGYYLRLQRQNLAGWGFD